MSGRGGKKQKSETGMKRKRQDASFEETGIVEEIIGIKFRCIFRKCY
jgi:hypothetical protein